MLIGILQLDLKITDALNLKDKRKVIRSLKDTWHHHHNVSVAEIDYLDHHNHALVGVAMVGNDAQHLESSLTRLVEHLRKERRTELLDFQIEIIPGH